MGTGSYAPGASLEAEEVIEKIKREISLHSDCNHYSDICDFHWTIEDIITEYDKSNGR